MNVTIERLAKVKFAGSYRNRHQPFCETTGDLVFGNPVCFVFPLGTDLVPNDRLIDENKKVYDVASVSKNGRTEAEVLYNDFETNFRLLEGNGHAHYGQVQSTGRDEDAEVFMDAWVGTYITNIVAHYDEIKAGRNLGELYGLFNHDAPAAVIGAGPSLDKNIDQLKRFPGVIIASDRAYRILLAHGINPDVVISVDTHYDLVAEMLDTPHSNKHALVLNVCSDPKIAKNWKGSIFWFLMKHPGVQFTDHILPALFPTFYGLENVGCVGNSSVVLADMMGLSPIVMVGQDFGYTGGRMFADQFKANADGSFAPIDFDHAAAFEKRTGKVTVDGITTYAPYLNFRAAAYNLRYNRGIDLINCTEGGILTELPCRSLAEQIDLLEYHNGLHASYRERILSVVRRNTHVRTAS